MGWFLNTFKNTSLLFPNVLDGDDFLVLKINYSGLYLVTGGLDVNVLVKSDLSPKPNPAALLESFPTFS